MWATIIKMWNRYSYVYIQGLTGTLCLAAITVLCGTVLGTLLAIMRRSRIKPFQWFIQFYVWVLRGTPILLQLYFFWIFLPRATGIKIPDSTCIIIALIVNASSYVSEIIRAGIQAVDIGQTEAARSLGMTARNTMTKIILPQAVKNILPSLANEFVSLVKESAILSFIGVIDIMFTANTVKNATYDSFGPYLFAAAIYFVLTFTLSKLVGLLEKKMAASN